MKMLDICISLHGLAKLFHAQRLIGGMKYPRNVLQPGSLILPWSEASKADSDYLGVSYLKFSLCRYITMWFVKFTTWQNLKLVDYVEIIIWFKNFNEWVVYKLFDRFFRMENFSTWTVMNLMPECKTVLWLAVLIVNGVMLLV